MYRIYIYIYIYIYIIGFLLAYVNCDFPTSIRQFYFFFSIKLLPFSFKPKLVGCDFFGLISFSTEVVKTRA